MATVERPAGSVETLRNVLSYLVAERHRLQSHDGSAVELDANMKAIVAIRSSLERSLREEPRRTC
jgi:hypothetical protein